MNHTTNFADIITNHSSIIEPNTTAFVSYTAELWKDLSLQSQHILKGISREVFYSYIDMPELLQKHLFKVFAGSNISNYLNERAFSTGMSKLFSGSFSVLADFAFELYDYSKKGVITRKDISLVLSNVMFNVITPSSTSNGNDKAMTYATRIQHQQLIFNLINTFFNSVNGVTAINKQQFITYTQSHCCDILLTPILFVRSCVPFSNDVFNMYTTCSSASSTTHNVLLRKQTVTPPHLTYNTVHPRNNNITHSGYIFKLTNKHTLKVFYCKLLANDLFYYKTSQHQQHEGMHHLSNNVFFQVNSRFLYNDVYFYSFSLVFPKKTRTYYVQHEHEFISWQTHIKTVLHQQSSSTTYTRGALITNTQHKYFTSYNGTHVQTKANVLICVANKRKITNTVDMNLLYTHINILRYHSQHRNMPQLLNVYETTDTIELVFNADNTAIDLFTYIHNNQYKPSELKTADIIHQLLMLVYYLQCFGVVHRDLKPESIMIIEDTEGNAVVKVNDFTLSKVLSCDFVATEPYGTLGYVAPEILLEKPYTNKVDMWSVGVIAFMLLCGTLPFDDEHSEREIARQTVYDDVPFRDNVWKRISKEAKEFVQRMLEKDSSKRWGVKEALMSKWMERFYERKVEERGRCGEKGECEFVAFAGDEWCVSQNKAFRLGE